MLNIGRDEPTEIEYDATKLEESRIRNQYLRILILLEGLPQALL